MLVDVKKTIFFILTFWRNKHLTIQELQDALVGLVVACVLDDIHIYDMFFVIY
jgi:hypothetical protein